MGFSFDDVPRRWFFDSTLTTAMANALNLVFPAGERFFIRSVKHYLPRITDPTLRARVRAFFGQEGSHGHEHEHAFEMLEAQGYEIRTWLRGYERLAFQILEPLVSPKLRLSTTVALEHLTAALAENVLTTDFFDHAHPAMAELLRWHAAEELEHKSVAFDVLQQVDPRYVVRLLGMVIGLTVLMAFWRSGTKMLLQQERGVSKAQLRRELAAAKARGQGRMPVFKAALAYLRPGFHPDQRDTKGLYEGYLRSIGRLEG
jgi:hypothetical protein